MRLLWHNGTDFVQLFIDSALDKYKNLQDLTDIVAARKNLKLDDVYWNKTVLASGLVDNIIHNVCIIQDANARFVTDKEKANWNQKVDRPITSNTQPGALTDGQIWYDGNTDTIKIMINGKLRDFENNRAASGTANFAGSNGETAIVHNIKNVNGAKVTPRAVHAYPIQNPGGCLGEMWIRKDNTHIYVGNTGSYTGAMEWVAFY